MSNNDYHILVLDDDPDIGMMIRIMLEYKGYKVSVAERAEKAQAILSREKINLMIMDMLLSGVNGVDICAQMKSGAVSRDLPVIMISAHPNARQLCLDAGANEFLAKPFDMQELFSRVSHLLKQETA
jgi:DNA-binding response OmpR family regulator